MRRYRRLSGKSLKKQRSLIIASLICLTLLFSVGYAAFSTNVTLNAKGNIAQITYAQFGGLSVKTVTEGDGLYDNGDGTYTYKGANPNNHIEFNNETWRIMRIDSQGIKIIKDESIGNMAFDEANARATENNSYCTSPSSGCNAWAATSNLVGSPATFVNGSASGTVTKDASLNTYLNGTYYTNTLGANSNIIRGTFNVGPSVYNNDDLAAAKTAEESYKWQGYVALATPVDYIEAHSDQANCSTETLIHSNFSCTTTNYLYTNFNGWWLLSPYSGISVDVRAFYNRELGMGIPYTSDTYSPTGVRPVLYLNKNIELSGSGTSDNMYTFEGSSGSSGGGSSTTQTVYALNTTLVTLGTSTINDLTSTETSQPYYTSAADVMSASGRSIYNKYTVENGVITAGYSCLKFSMLSEPVCLQGGNSSYYSDSKAILTELSNDVTFTTGGGHCEEQYYEEWDWGSYTCGVGDLNANDAICISSDRSGYATSTDGQISSGYTWESVIVSSDYGSGSTAGLSHG